LARLDQSAGHAKLIISTCLSIDVFAIPFIITFPAFCIFPIRQNFHVDIYICQAVALGQSGNNYLSIDSLYPLGASLTGSPFELASPLLALRGGREARNPKYYTLYYGYLKKNVVSQ
jgi:hypothetical protein